MGRSSKDLTNLKFNRLLALNPVSKNKRGCITWLFQCDCGNKKILAGSRVSNNSIKSCGCLRSDIGKKTIPYALSFKKLEIGEAGLRALYSAYRHNAKKRELAFKLSKDEFKIITKQNCYYCGVEPKQHCYQRSYNGNYVYNGIDRKDNKKGYTLANCVPCCGKCNTAKMGMSKDDFLAWIYNIYKFNFKD